MTRPIVVLGAASSIGIRPYDDGSSRRLDAAPEALRLEGLVERLGARDSGDVPSPPYRDRIRPPGRARNEAEVASYSRALAERVRVAVDRGAFVLLLGGDCSILLGALLGAREAVAGHVGLVYIDAHADFATPEESQTGSVASMDLALALGRGDTPLARLAGDEPLVRAEHVVLLARRDDAEAWYGDALARSGILDLTGTAVAELGVERTLDAVRDRVQRADGFWLHVDVDVLDPEVMPAVDSPEPGGLGLEELAALVGPLARDPSALGMEVTIYDPHLDPTREGAGRLTDFLEKALVGSSA